MKKGILPLSRAIGIVLMVVLMGATGNEVFGQSYPTGAIAGVFSVGENTGVCFSQGNLQYQASTDTWRFAENQWDYVGSDNANISETYSGWIDLFGWGTSGYHDSSDPYNVNYEPWSIWTSEVNTDYNYYGYGPSTNMSDQNLTGTSANYDWGVYNAISNGGNTTNTWRTLTNDEWDYVFFTRSTSSGIRYAKAMVNNINGVILLPDDWQSSYYALNSANTNDASFSTNTIDATQWSTLEQHGAVFLPAAGYRNGNSVYRVSSYGEYWSSSYSGGSSARLVSFLVSSLYTGYMDDRVIGHSVRLARSLQNYSVTTSPNPAEGGAVSGGGAYGEGADCTLTATASAGYTFAYWTENGRVVSTDASYTFAVNGDRVLVANFTEDSSSGNLNGVFSVGENTGVCFSQGNLQYQASTDTWRFAENQWDYVGSGNANASETYSGLIDLFGWGTSGYNHGASCYQPWSASTSDSDYYAYGSYTCNLYDQTGQADWGYNAISNGGNTENSGWRTLTGDEWDYVFNTRSTSSGIRYAKANVNNITGVILLPDDWQSSYYELNSTNTFNASYNTNIISIEVWSTLEQHGAVFLPAAGYRYGTPVYSVGFYGGYWSSSYDNGGHARRVYFSDSGLYAGGYDYRYDGHSVRLARSLQYYSVTASPNPAEGGAVSGGGAYETGAECTLTATASAVYQFVNWTEDGEVVSTDNPLTFTVTSDRQLTANFERVPCHWTPATGMSGSMTFLGILKVDDVQSTADYLEIGAFCGTECRGSALPKLINGVYIYALNVSGNTDGDTITFRLYDHHLDRELNLHCINEIIFEDGAFYGSDELYEFNFYSYLLTTEFKQGWTWWSTGMELSDIDGLGLLEAGLTPYGRVIKTNDQFVQYQTAMELWIGELSSLTNEAGYKVQTSQACSVTLMGAAADSQDHPITIYPDWTWIGYPVTYSQTVATALTDFEPEVNDIIKSQSSSARYLPNTGWIPSSFTLNPGESYMYYSKATAEKTLVYAEGRSAATATSDDRHWRNDVHAFADNLCLLAVVELEGVEQRSEELELGAFVDGVCRGSAKLMYVETLDRYYAMMNVMGEDGDVVEFALMDGRDGTTYQSDDRLGFVTDAVVGEFQEPYVVRFGGSSSAEEHDTNLGLYPNPVDRDESFRLQVPEGETVTEWTVVNALGAVLRHETRDAALSDTEVEGLPVSGVYLVKVSCKSGRTYWSRLVVK